MSDVQTCKHTDRQTDRLICSMVTHTHCADMSFHIHSVCIYIYQDARLTYIYGLWLHTQYVFSYTYMFAYAYIQVHVW